jgi:hypothetical protein
MLACAEVVFCILLGPNFRVFLGDSVQPEGVHSSNPAAVSTYLRSAAAAAHAVRGKHNDATALEAAFKNCGRVGCCEQLHL